ncbi:hypothetical protein [Kitasatospora cineracea]|uniref:Lipoprotein n=1 Tax=Kitasatospora cineracea TaxID=88074 RepID=A0A3N4RLU2_9ACTN|nr:hypothetical protein [Kitasatospora cineracea]RPE34388.1 hypothetical protein EDD38_2703 [Kitasatospora cineracea]
MRATRLLAVTVLSVLGVTGLTACGSDGTKKGDSAPAASGSAGAAASKPAAAGGGLEGLSVEQIMTKMRAANGKLKSVKAVFEVQDSDGDISGDVASGSAGDCAGTIGIKGKGKAEILRTGGKVWLKPDAEFIKVVVPGADASVANLIAGKWLTSTKTTDLADGFGEFCDMPLGLLKKAGLNDDGTPDNSGTKGGTKKVGGVDAVVLKVKGEKSGDAMEVAVANQGEAYLLSVDSGATGSMRFSDFDKPVQAAAPAADQVIDLDELKKAAG